MTNKGLLFISNWSSPAIRLKSQRFSDQIIISCYVSACRRDDDIKHTQQQRRLIDRPTSVGASTVMRINMISSPSICSSQRANVSTYITTQIQYECACNLLQIYSANRSFNICVIYKLPCLRRTIHRMSSCICVIVKVHILYVCLPRAVAQLIT